MVATPKEKIVQKCQCPIWVKYGGPIWDKPCWHCCFENLCTHLAKGMVIKKDKLER